MTALAINKALSPPVTVRSGAVIECAHCGLPVPEGLRAPGAAEQFCCRGCETARHAIRAGGLERFYEYARADASMRRPAAALGARYEEFDDPEFLRRHATDIGNGMSEATFVVEGMHCAACVWLLERLPRVQPSVVECRADLGRGQIRLVWQREGSSVSTIARTIDSLGYAVHPLRERAAHEARKREDRAAMIRIGVAGALFGNTMVIAFALYGGHFEGMEQGFRLYLRGASAALAVLSVFGPGMVFFRGAAASLRVRALHMDVPIALALLVGLIHGIVNTIRDGGDVYFDTLTTLVFLLLIGRSIQQRQQRRAADSLEMLFSLTPSRATLVEGNRTRVVPVESLHPGDLVEVRAGESVPIDGTVTEGSSSVNLSLLTGESRPVGIGPGDRIAAGCINLSAPIRAHVEATGRDTRVGQLMAMVEDQARRKAPMVRLADRIAAWFVGVVLVIAAATMLLWLPSGIEPAVEATVSLLIITCPCALGLATPLAIISAIGHAARRGVLIKGGEALEALAGNGTIVLDKTGTITRGDLRVLEYHGPDRLKPLIAAAERECSHPVARALCEAFDSDGLRVVMPTIRHTLGGGIEASSGRTEIVIGSVPFVLARASSPLHQRLRERLDEGIARGLSPVLVAENGTITALILLGDELRDGAQDMITDLTRWGWRPMILSGDDPRIALAIGQRLGLPRERVIGGASPEDKARIVSELRERGPTVMVGDGVNDSAALAAATVGIAVHGGAEAAMSAADVYLSKSGLAALRELFLGARRTARAIRVNLGVSLGYNLIFGSLAVAGLVNPLLAAVLMPLSSITVVVLSYRSGAFRSVGEKYGGAS